MSQLTYEQVQTHLTWLKLNRVLEQLDSLAEQASKQA